MEVKMEKRKERLKDHQTRFDNLFQTILFELDNIDLAEGIDQTSWLYAGCKEDLEKARTRILNYIERVLR